MKKLLSLVLVLGMVSLASAGIVLVKLDDVTAAVVRQPGWDDWQAYNAYLAIEQTGNPYTIAFTPAGDPAGTSTVGPIEEYEDGFDWRFLTVASLDPSKMLQPGPQVLVTIADPSIQTIVGLYDSSGYELWGEVTLGLVPEPASMLLLGLGGLFLRRK